LFIRGIHVFAFASSDVADSRFTLAIRWAIEQCACAALDGAAIVGGAGIAVVARGSYRLTIKYAFAVFTDGCIAGGKAA
jgi:hypothetical protein